MLFTTSLVIPRLSSAQIPDSTNPTQTAPAPVTSLPGPASRAVSWKLLLPNILSDQKEIWTFPVRLAQGHHLIPTAAVLGTTATLTMVDPYEASYFRRASGFHWFNNTFTGNA